MIFLRATLLDLLNDPIEDILKGNSRWTLRRRAIVEHEGKFYEVMYSQGATEMQDEDPWEYQDEIECQEVQKVSKTIEVWEPVSPLCYGM